MQRWRSWCSSALLLLVALPAVVNAQIYSVQHEPTHVAEDLGPENLAILGVNRNGPQSDTAIKYQYQYIYIGCFWAPMNITMDSEQDTSFDPSECIDVCLAKAPIYPRAEVVAAVQGKRCGCVKPSQVGDNPQDLMRMFEPSDNPVVDCFTGCKYFDNPLCGGDQLNQYWGVFKEYDYQSMSSQGAYDPWRYVWYTVVVMLERTIIPSYREDGLPLQADDTPLPPERYYLCAIDAQSGRPAFQYQAQLPGIVQGLQFDLDSSRLVGVLVSNEIGRTRFDRPWSYKLITIFINTTLPTYPNMTFENDYPIINLEEELEKEQFLYTGASAIVSRKDWDTYVFVLIQDQIGLRTSKNNIYFVSIPSGAVLLANGLDMRVIQLFSNEKYGDVTVAAIRYQQTVWLYIARVTFNQYTQRTEIKYSYSASRPEFLVDPPEATDDKWLMPGASCSEHLYNKSYSLLRNMSNNYQDPRPPNQSAILMMEVLIRPKTYDYFCDKDAGCWNSMNATIPYAAIYNREPRIPLSLKSPELILAKFDMEATSIDVYFDQNTLKGAVPIDTNNDILPDMIDYNSQLTGQWDCARVFDDNTVLLIGPSYDGTYCEWKSDQHVKITLPRGEFYPPVDVGDQLYLRADSIYTVPRDGEYSAAAQGGIEVSLPDPLLPPTILLSGANVVDECTPVEFNAADSYNVGGRPTYNWSLNEYPVDLTNNPAGRIWDAAKIDYIYEALENATDDNAAVLSLDTKRLSPAAKYMIKLVVISRWNLNASEIVELTRLDFPSPLVDIKPPTPEIIRNRTDEVVLTAEGTPSQCVGVTRELGYRWTETSGKLDLSTVPDLVYTTKTLIIPAFTLEPAGSVGEYNVYNFTVECYVASQPNRFATDWIVVKIQRSAVFAYLSMEDRLLTRGKDLVLDARQSQDMDYPTASGQTFKGTFSWWCFGPGNTPCFANLIDKDNPFYLGSSTEPTLFPACNTNIYESFTVAGASFSKPVWAGTGNSYCKWARGVLMATTKNFTIDNYTWTVQAQAYDGRAANKTVVITMTEYDVPVINLEIADVRAKYPITGTIRINGQIESEFDPAANPLFRWSIWLWTSNSDYDIDAAQLAETTGTEYNVPQQIFVDKSEELNLTNPTDPNKFSIQADVPNMIILPNALIWESSLYKVRLIVDMFGGAVSSFADVTLETAGGPARPGSLDCSPITGTISTPRILTAADWVAEDTPLTYRFGYLKPTGGIILKVPLHAEASPVSTQTKELPLGDASTNYSITVYVDVLTTFDVITTHELEVQSKPPKNVSEATQILLNKMNAPGADAEETLEDANTVLAIQQMPSNPPGVQPSPEDAALISQVLGIINQATDNVPVTVNTNTQVNTVLQQAVDAGYRTEETMDGIEKSILSGANAGLFVPENQQLAHQALDLIGNMLPDCSDPVTCQEQAGFSAAGATLPTGGRRLEAHKQQRRLEASRRLTTADKRKGIEEDPGHINSTRFPRRDKNHPVQKRTGEVLHSCPTAYCDVLYIRCIRMLPVTFIKGFKSQLLEIADRKPQIVLHTCCGSVNPRTMCNQPPCWFRGNKCPMAEASEDSPQSSSEEPERRLQENPEKVASADWAWQWSEELGYRSLNAHKSSAVSKSASPGIANTSEYTTEILENIYRRLQASTPLVGSRGVESEDRILFLESLEEPILVQVQRDLANRNRAQDQLIRADARLELLYEQMSPIQAELAKKEAADARADTLNELREIERGFSQMITRTGVLRDTICKQMIVQMTTSVEVLRFDTTAFTLWMGKTRNMSSVRPSMIFPDKFVVPPNTPDYPTADNPLSAFAYIYMEYKRNIYGWSDSAPPGNESNIMTIIVMKASTTEVLIRNETDPIRVFADESLYSSALCMYWDRFAPNTAGGAWSTRGLLNDGEGCLTTHLSDIGLFVDGRIPTSILVDKAVSYYLEDTIDGPEGSKYNLSTVVVIGFSIFLGTTLALAGYIQDELTREREKAGKAPHAHWLGGNGVTSAINVDDCIAYDHINTRHWFLVITLWKVILRDHAVLGLFRYHHAFTRPQRILCVGVMATSILAVNAMIYGVPKELVSGDQFVPSGVISGLVSFPLFVACIFMFASRPTLLKKRLIKRATDTSSVDAMRQEREKIERESAKYYPIGNKDFPPLQALPMPQGGFVAAPSLLALPAAVPLWPTAPLPPGMALPPPPPPTAGMLPLANGAPSGMLPVAALRGATGLPSLPPLPKLNPSMHMLPPVPKYQPPSATLSRPGLPAPGRGLGALPPINREMNAPPQNMAVTDGGTTTPQEPRTPPDTARNALPPLPAPPSTPPGGPNRAPDQQTTSLPGSFAPEGSHQAADTEATQAPVERDLQEDAIHGVMGGIPPPPSEPPPDDGYDNMGFATPRTPMSAPPSDYTGTFQNPPPPIMTPPSGPGLFGAGGISASGIVYRGEAPPLIPPPSYAPGYGTLPPRHPPEPPNTLRLPQYPGLPKAQSAVPVPGFGLPKGVPGPLVPGEGGIGLPPPNLVGSFMSGAGDEGRRKMVPPPPPPPKEDDAVFVRRLRLVGLERSEKEQAKRVLEHAQDPAKDIPSRIYIMMTLCPYVACMVSICAQVFITLAYSMKFQRISERYWYYSTVIGLCEVLLVLEFMRSAVMMIVELRKFEIRRRLYGGAFNQSRVGRRLEGPDALRPNKQTIRTPKVPSVAPKKPSALQPPPPPKPASLGPPPLEALSAPDGSNPRPAFLPPLGGTTLTPPGTGTGMATLLAGASGGVSLPVGKAPPSTLPPPGTREPAPHKMPPGMPQLDFNKGLPGTNTPPRLSGSIGQAGGMSLLPGQRSGNTPPRSHLGTPKLGQSSSTAAGEIPAPPPIPSKARPQSPTGSVASNMSKSLSEKMAANRMATAPGAPGMAKQPTPPGSHRAQAKPPSTPPGSQSVAQKRAAMRGPPQ